MNIKITRLRNIINFADIIMVHNLWSKTIMKIILKAFLRQLPISASNLESFEKWFKRVLEFKAWIFLPVNILDGAAPCKNSSHGNYSKLWVPTCDSQARSSNWKLPLRELLNLITILTLFQYFPCDLFSGFFSWQNWKMWIDDYRLQFSGLQLTRTNLKLNY